MSPDEKTFQSAASFLNVPWFRIYLAVSLIEEFGLSEKDSGELLRWLILHVAVQAGRGHLRTRLSSVETEMPQWYSWESKSIPDFIEPELPHRLAEFIDDLISEGEASGLIGRLPAEDFRADDLPVPRSPLVLTHDGEHLYVLRRRREEDRFLELLSLMTSTSGAGVAFYLPADIEPGPAVPLTEVLASGRRLALLAGGPGTGKTTTVASLLKVLARGRGEAGMPPLRVALAAPTGRAAARMMEGLAVAGLGGGDWRGQTLHSLLGMSPGRPPRHHADNPVSAELVVVDEASMVDLPMMNALLDALPPSAALLLVGDPDQLPSVEAGALLGDLLAGAEESASGGTGHGPLSGAVVRLKKVYRSDTAILEAAAAVRTGDSPALERALKAPGGVVSLGLGRPEEAVRDISRVYADAVGASRYVRNLDDKTAVENVFKQFGTLAVLGPLRRGLWGSSALNDRISQAAGGGLQPFAGMPIMITSNDAERNLWNGDRGVVLELDGRLRAVFQAADGFRTFPLAALPGWEAAWVQTIHKSQGSEYERVLVLLPHGAERLLSREILYTALTRAKHRVELHAHEGTIPAALERKVLRRSRIKRWAAQYCS